jgi:hypothetical protein
MYASLLVTSSALYLDVFEQPVNRGITGGFTSTFFRRGGGYGF